MADAAPHDESPPRTIDRAAQPTESPPALKSVVKDIVLWTRKKFALSILFISTATWVLLDVYQFNFITIVSWMAMAVVTLLFLWGNLLRILSKDQPELSRLYVSEEFSVKTANYCREIMEEFIRWMFRVSVEKEWFVFARTVFVLLVLSYVGSLFDFPTFLFIGTLLGMTAPLILEKNKERIRKCGEMLKERSRRVYEMADAKILKKMKNKLSKEEKQKKTE